jgi:hypothetical protein
MTEENAAPAMKWYTEAVTARQVAYAAITGAGVAACHLQKAETTGWRKRLETNSQNMSKKCFRWLLAVWFGRPGR